MFEVTLSTDGACKGNPGPGGYCGILHCKGHRCVVEGFLPESTNNRAELTAVIESVKHLTKPCNITILTDATYVISCLNWLEGKSKAKANFDLLTELKELSKVHTFSFQKVKGHAGDPDNEECDRRAKAQIDLHILKGA